MKRIVVALVAVLAVLMASGPSEARYFKVIPNMISDTMTAACPLDTGDPAVGAAGYAFTAESTAIFDVGDYSNIGLFLRVIPAAGDTTTAIRLAIQIRAHTDLTGDSSSTYAWALWQAQASAAIPDTMNNRFSTSSPPAGEGCGVWTGEFQVTYGDPVRGRGGMKTNEYFGSPSGMYIPIASRTGSRFTAPYMSIRVRLLSGASKPRVILGVGLVQ